MRKSYMHEVWTITGYLEPNLYGDGGESSDLFTGTTRQCMEYAISLTPKYLGWGLTIKSICEAWDDIFFNNANYAWLDRKHEYFFMKREGMKPRYL